MLDRIDNGGSIIQNGSSRVGTNGVDDEKFSHFQK